jgi:hypothetical protein
VWHTFAFLDSTGRQLDFVLESLQRSVRRAHRDRKLKNVVIAWDAGQRVDLCNVGLCTYRNTQHVTKLSAVHLSLMRRLIIAIPMPRPPAVATPLLSSDVAALAHRHLRHQLARRHQRAYPSLLSVVGRLSSFAAVAVAAVAAAASPWQQLWLSSLSSWPALACLFRRAVVDSKPSISKHSVHQRVDCATPLNNAPILQANAFAPDGPPRLGQRTFVASSWSSCSCRVLWVLGPGLLVWHSATVVCSLFSNLTDRPTDR